MNRIVLNKIKTVLGPAILATAILTSCAPPPGGGPPPPPIVTVTNPRMVTVTNWDEYPGHLEAVEMVEVKSRVFGYLMAIHFKDGAEVKTGELLFEIDPKPFQADLERARADKLRAEALRLGSNAEFQRAEARLELAVNDLKRAEALRGTKAISEEEFDLRTKTTREAQATLAAAKAAIGAAEAAVSAAVAAETNATLNLEYTRVKAPINGRIGRRFVTEGNLVQGSAAGATVLATIVSLDPIYCYFDVNDQAFPLYRRQMGAPGAAGRETSLTCELSVGAETNFAYQGQVDFYDNEVNAKTGTIRMRGVFANADRRLVPGLFGLVRIPTGPPQETMAVPAVAVSSDQGRSFVMVVNNENVVLPKPIKAERQHGALRAVPEGLNLNDRVIINGLMMARPGSKVVITNAPASGGAAMPKANP